MQLEFHWVREGSTIYTSMSALNRIPFKYIIFSLELVRASRNEIENNVPESSKVVTEFRNCSVNLSVPNVLRKSEKNVENKEFSQHSKIYPQILNKSKN